MTSSPLPHPLHIFRSPEVVAVFNLIGPLGLRCCLTRLATMRLRTVTLAPAIIRAWNKMLAAVAALPARRRSHGGGKAATLARSNARCPGPSGRQLNPRPRRTSCLEDQDKKMPKENSPAEWTPKSIFKPVESDQFQIGTTPRLCSGQCETQNLHLQMHGRSNKRDPLHGFHWPLKGTTLVRQFRTLFESCPVRSSFSAVS